MSQKALKRNSYWLMERNKKQTDVEKIKFKKICAINNPSKHKSKLKNSSFVKTCVEIAKQKKTTENAIKYSKASKEFFYPSEFKKV